MRAHLARALRAIADRLAGQAEVDALRLDNRRLETLLASEKNACERYIAERDRAWRDAECWRSSVDGLNGALLSQGAAARRLLSPEVARPVFGRRDRPPHLRPVD